MGQKVHPISFRLGYLKTWSSRWYARKADFARFLHEDLKVRKHVQRTFTQAAIAKVDIERASDKIRVYIHTARPGVIIGRKGADIDRLREELQSVTGNKEVHINIVEIKNPSSNAQLISEIARAEGYLEGTVPLHTLRADIDYGFSEANTTYGKIGVKVIVYKGDILKGLNTGKKEETIVPVQAGTTSFPAATQPTEGSNVTPDA
jgi:small subunit ribosomal protein S3